MRLQTAQHGGPALGALSVAILDRDQLLRPIGPHTDHHEGAEAVFLQADAEVDPVGPDVDVVNRPGISGDSFT